MTFPRRASVLIVDSILIVVSYFFASLLHNDFSFPSLAVPDTYQLLAIIFIVKILVFGTSNMYRSIWRYASLHDMVEIFKTVTVASILSVLALVFFGEEKTISRVVVVLDWGILLSMVSASRLAWRLYRERYAHAGNGKENGSGNGNQRRTLIVGAGDAGNMLLRDIFKQAESPYRIIGLLDDDRTKWGLRMYGVEVLGGTDQIQEMVERHRIDKVIIAVPSAGAKFVRNLIHQCTQSQVRFKIIPGMNEILRGDVNISHLRDVEIEDLLGREAVRLDEAGIGGYLRGMRVLISGAAGSIGSEICRQVARFSPAMLVLLDNAESPLFYIERELSASFPTLRLVTLLGDVRNRERLEQIFDDIMPQVVFHAAAYKHVPLVEHNPAEAVLCNVLGSMNLATVSAQFGVRNFVQISTDKAVNPTNVMGATKRVAEKFIQTMAEGSTTKFTTVRFGNVLGSNGSVVPLFTEQIRTGGPLTITHPEVTRFFMTIPEASQLVLQAACYGSGGEIFVLDMGEPVRIVELAEQLVRLSGLTPYSDIEFVYTGLRPGEKLYEELFFLGENILKTPHEKIHVLAPGSLDYDQLCTELEKLLAAARDNDIPTTRNMLCTIVPEYSPAAS